MKLNKANKKVKGFTLIELIVVIAIIGVLAAILVPSMMGYVKKSKMTTANSNAKSLFDAVNTTCTDYEVQGKVIDGSTGKVVTADAETAIIDSTILKEFTDKVSGSLSFKSGSEWVALIDKGQVKATAFHEKGDKYIGTYPREATADDLPASLDAGITYAQSKDTTTEAPKDSKDSK